MSDTETSPTVADADSTSVVPDGQVADSPLANADMILQLCDVFFQYAKQFIEALCEVWPECSQLRSKKLEFEMACVHGPQSICLANRKELFCPAQAVSYS